MQDMLNKFLLTSEVARIFEVVPATIRLWERQGRIKAVRTNGGVRLFNRRDVERLARERERETVSSAA
jgi:excisionase family DNA binding protein